MGNPELALNQELLQSQYATTNYHGSPGKYLQPKDNMNTHDLAVNNMQKNM